jgi:predicted transposase YbfD/YdcC
MIDNLQSPKEGAQEKIMSLLVEGIQDHFQELPEFRKRKVRKYPLLHLVFIALCAMLAGADNFTDMALWAKKNKQWLEQRFGEMEDTPSHDTLGRFFELIDRRKFFECFVKWTSHILNEKEETQGCETSNQICLDGKVSKASFDSSNGIKPLHLVRAWATDSRMVLEQQKVEDKTNEITAIPEILRRLDLNGVLVSIDAMGTHKEIAQQIVEQGGNYLLVLKENHKLLYDRVLDSVSDWDKKKWKIPFPFSHAKSVDKSKGFLEIRKCHLIKSSDIFDVNNEWKDLYGIAIVEREIVKNGKSVKRRRFYLTNLTSAHLVLKGSRNHWGIENQCHWLLDVLFLEDINRARIGYSAENLSSLRQMCLSLLRAETSTKLSLRAKRKAAGWDNDYLSQVLDAGRRAVFSLCD